MTYLTLAVNLFFAAIALLSILTAVLCFMGRGDRLIIRKKEIDKFDMPPYRKYMGIFHLIMGLAVLGIVIARPFVYGGNEWAIVILITIFCVVVSSIYKRFRIVERTKEEIRKDWRGRIIAVLVAVALWVVVIIFIARY